MADHRRLNNNEFKNLLDQIFDKADGKAADYGLTQVQVDAVKATAAGIETGIAEQTATRAAAKAATAAINQKRKGGDALVADLKLAMRAAKLPPEKFIELGFDADDLTPTPTGVFTPTDLVVQGASDGTNTLKFKRSGNGDRTVFIVEAKIGDAADYSIVGTTTKAAFNHTGQTPGVKAMYRVRAQRGEQISGYSNEAIVYA